MRMLGHNGEINTLLGNINWVRAREGGLDTSCEFDPEGDTQNFINNCDIQGGSYSWVKLARKQLLRAGGVLPMLVVNI